MSNKQHSRGGQAVLAPGQLMCFVCAGNAVVAYQTDQTADLGIDIAVTWAPWQTPTGFVTVPVCLLHLGVQKQGALLQGKGDVPRV